jgi:hypothetical protein
MEIPFNLLPSHNEWRDGVHFAEELNAWTHGYEEEVCVLTSTNDQYVRVYVDSALRSLPNQVRLLVRKLLGEKLDDTVRTSLALERPGSLLQMTVDLARRLRKLYLRHFSLPRARPVKLVEEGSSQLHHFGQKTLQPWYVKPTFWSTWGPLALLLRLLGGKVPGSHGVRFQPQGYDLMTIGPEPQKGKGKEEMKMTMDIIKSKSLSSCPFSAAKEA